MAILVLKSADTSAERMPMMCMVCGAHISQNFVQSFAWRPEWLSTMAGIAFVVGTPLAIPVLLVHLLVARRRTIAVPACDRHASWWWFKAHWVYVPLPVLLLFEFGGLYLIVTDPSPFFLGVVAFGIVVRAMALLVASAVVQRKVTRVIEITEEDITFANADAKFVAATEKRRFWNDFDGELDVPYREAGLSAARDPRDTFRAR